MTSQCLNHTDTLMTTEGDISYVGLDDLLKKYTHRPCQTHTHTLPRMQAVVLLGLQSDEWRADPSLAGRGSFLKGHGRSSQTKHRLIALLFVGSMPVFLCCTFPLFSIPKYIT